MKYNYILKQEIFDALEKVAGFFPYKIPGNADTYDEYNEAWNDAIGRAEMEIESLPSADVVPVVRCVDCRRCSYDPLFNYFWCNLTIGTRKVNPDDFCSYGERREE